MPQSGQDNIGCRQFTLHNLSLPQREFRGLNLAYLSVDAVDLRHASVTEYDVLSGMYGEVKLPGKSYSKF